MRKETVILLTLSLLLLVETTKASIEETSEEDENLSDFELFGEPISILEVTSQNDFLPHNEAIDKIFDNDELRDRKIVAVSAVGVFRKGKSFLLNYFLRYLYGNFKSLNYNNNPLNNTQNWMGHPKQPLTGFKWRAGVQRETNGINIWSDVFLHTSPNGDKLGIILIDTQGLFDQKTSPTVNSKMFALATLISSVQIYNLHNVVQEDQLQYLQFTSDFAKLINNIESKDESKNLTIEKPFQKILLLMRDWVNPKEYPYGLEGGEKYLNSVLQITKSQEKDAREVRKFIRSSYENVSCFLMPHPGNKVLNSDDFEGEWLELNSKFVENLNSLSKWLFEPSNLAPKKFMNKFTSAEEYAEHLKSYFEAAASNSLMNVSTIFEATMETEGNIIIEKSLRIMKTKLRESENFEDKNFLNQFDEMKIKSQDAAMLHFKEQVKSFSDKATYVQKWMHALQTQVTREFKDWKNEVTDNYNKFQKAKLITQQEISRKLEEVQNNFQKQLKEMSEKNDQERLQIESKLNSSLKSFEIEKIKIQQENEIERTKIVQEKLKDLENAKKQCEALISNAQNDYASELNRLKSREEHLKSEKQRLEAEQDEQQKKLAKKLEERNRNYQRELQRLREGNEQTKKNLERKVKEMEEAAKRQKILNERAEINYRLQLEEHKLRLSLGRNIRSTSQY